VANLTEISVSNLRPPDRGQKLYADGVVKGLYLRVSQGGSKSFVLVQGKARRFRTLGRHGVIGLAEARRAAKRILAERTLGRILPVSVPLSVARSEYLAEIDIRKNTRDYYARHLNRLRASKLSDITPKDINDILKPLSRSSRNQCLASFRAFFKWCLRGHHIEKNPCELMQLSQSPSRARVLADAELKAVWIASDDCGTFGVIVKLLILTGQRPGEIAALRKEWICNDTITIPKEVTKNARAHTFPISTLSQRLLFQSTSASATSVLFPARGKPSSPFNGWSKSKAALDKASRLTDWTLHDLRRTYATKMAALGTPIHVTERLLNHVSGGLGGIVAVYNRHTYMDEMRAAVELYENWFASIVTGSVANGPVPSSPMSIRPAKPINSAAEP
jgi:integrase